MARDPLSSFLAGFDAVDRLETRRQLRSERAEQQSRLRKMWQRQDEVYEQAQLQYFQKQKAVEFEATSDTVMQEISDSIDEFERRLQDPKRSDREKKSAQEAIDILRKKWMAGTEASTANWLNEVNRRMLERDPQYGELLALAHGQDPAAGPLIKDKKNPVAAVGFLPERGMYAAVNAITSDAPVPLTEGRTANNDDPIWFGKTGMGELARIFGPAAYSEDLATMRMLRGLLQPAPTGSPVDLNKADAARDKEATKNKPTANTEVVAKPPEDTENVDPDFDPDFDPKFDSSENVDPNFDPNFDPAFDFDPNAKPPQINPRTGEPYPPRPEAPVNKFLREEVQPVIDEVEEGRTEVGRGGLGATFAGNLDVAAENLSAAAAKTKEFLRKGTLIRLPQSTKDVQEMAATGQGPSAKDLTAAAPEKGQEEKVPDVTEEQAKQVATELLRNEPTYNRPPPEEVFKAYLLQKAGVLTTEQVVRFKQTGSFDEQVREKLHFVTSDGITTGMDPYSGQVRSRTQTGVLGGGDQDKPATVQDHAALQNFYQDILSDIEDPYYQQKAINAMQGAATILGAGSDTKRDLATRAKHDVTSMLRGGMGLINEFDEDTIQGLWDAGNLDFTWGDFEVDLTAGNVAIASQLYVSDVGGKKERAHALRDYTRDFVGLYPRMSEQRMAERVGEIEQKIKLGIDMANRTGEGQIPILGGGSVIIAKGDTPHEIRQKIFVALNKG